MVTVVDAGAFLEAYTTGDRMIQRPDLGVSGERQRMKQKFSRARIACLRATLCCRVYIIAKLGRKSLWDQLLANDFLLLKNIMKLSSTAVRKAKAVKLRGFLASFVHLTAGMGNRWRVWLALFRMLRGAEEELWCLSFDLSVAHAE